MGLKATIASAVATAFTALGDIPTSVTYRQPGVTSYNATTGAYVATPVDTAVTAILVEYTQSEVKAGTVSASGSESILASDRKAIVQAVDLNGVTLSLADRLVISGVLWDVIDFSTDPADATHTFQIRRGA